MGSGVIHLARTHEGGEGTDTSKYVRKKVAFCSWFVIFSYARCFCHTLLSLASIFTSALYSICFITSTRGSSKCTFAYDGERRGSNFSHFGAYVLIE